MPWRRIASPRHQASTVAHRVANRIGQLDQAQTWRHAPTHSQRRPGTWRGRRTAGRQPSSRLKAQANSAKHITFIMKPGGHADQRRADEDERHDDEGDAAAPASLAVGFGRGGGRRRVWMRCAMAYFSGPNRPAGRISSTMVMMTKMTVVEASGIEHLGQALDQAQAEAGDDGAHDGAHAADHHHGEHHDDQVGTHLRADLVNGRGHHAGQRGQRHARNRRSA